MKLKDGRITILASSEGVKIEISDNDASSTFVEVFLTPEQFTSAIGRLAFTKCEVNVNRLERVGKTHKHRVLEFMIPKEISASHNAKELHKIAQQLLDMEGNGEVADGGFGSQDTFFTKDGIPYARTIARRWE